MTRPLLLLLLAAAALTAAQDISTMSTDQIRAALLSREEQDASEGVEAAESFDGRAASAANVVESVVIIGGGPAGLAA